MRRCLPVVLAACWTPEPCEVDEYVAFQEDFATYRSWYRIDLPEPDTRLGADPRSVYIDRWPEPGDTAFATCTKIVKVAEVGDDPTGWLMVGMAKQGGGYNADGAAGWEWFDLDPSPTTTRPLIDWRGPTPPEGRGYECALGEGEAGAERIGDCTTCHRAAASNDFVLTPGLQLDAL